MKGESDDLSDISYIPSYTFIYLSIPLNTFIYPKMLPYTFIYISNTRKMRINIRTKNGHNSGSSASPKVRI